MPEIIVKAVPDYTQFGRATKLRLNTNHIEDLEWTKPEELCTLPIVPDQEGSEVTECVPSTMSQDSTTASGEYFRTTEQDTSWFWSITERFKEGLPQ